jgi:hypothetical protein
MLVAKPRAQPPEAADHLIRHQQDAVFAADGLHARPIAPGRDHHAACALHRFADEGGHIFGANGQNALLDGGGGARGEGILILAKPSAN